MLLGLLACSRSWRYVAGSSNYSRAVIMGYTPSCSCTVLAPALMITLSLRNALRHCRFRRILNHLRYVTSSSAHRRSPRRRVGLWFKADDQMRQRYDSMLADCPMPRMWGLSLLGTSLRVHCGDTVTGDLEPAFEDHPRPRRTLPRNSP